MDTEIVSKMDDLVCKWMTWMGKMAEKTAGNYNNGVIYSGK